MSGAHARQRLAPSIGLAVWRPIAALALLGAGAPAVAVLSAEDARSAPASASAPDVSPEPAAPHLPDKPRSFP